MGELIQLKPVSEKNNKVIKLLQELIVSDIEGFAYVAIRDSIMSVGTVNIEDKTEAIQAARVLIDAIREAN